MNTQNIKAIIFDFDGVIVDSAALHEKAEDAVYRHFNIPVPEEGRERFRGQTLTEILTFVSKEYGTGQENIEQMMAYKSVLYKEYRDQSLSLVPGIKEFLQKISANQKYRLAIGTAGRKSVQEELLEKHGLNPYFEFIVSAGDVTKGKPDPEIYTTAVNKLGLQAEECLVIEDAVNGIVSAKAAGCVACGITTGMPKEALLEAGADLVVDSFEELWMLLEEKY